ncbi:S-layer homology domain-containing protein [Paenibacillus koleovorans]|uniref:S-layer homology domain-containing protein n=1 Tax=Paenibacillus koleovorans TaxID=121608 RepID=UPI001FE2A5E5|nr:S-layer homology domain-containing protein [Paenibacillus koleovorans]
MLNKTMLRKTSGLLAALMIVSMLVPVLAFAAAWFKDVTYNSDGTVTGQVYFDSDRVTDSVYLNVYSNGNLYSSNSVNTATYSTYADGYYYYNFSFSVTDATYNPITLSALVNGTEEGVTDAVYKQTPPPCTNCGGGGVIIPPVTGNDTIDVTNGTVDSDKLKKSLADYTTVTLKVQGDTVQIPASALIDALSKEGATIVIVAEHGTYILPLSVLKLDDLAKELGVEVNDLKINVSIAEVTGATATAIADAIEDLGGESMADAVEFTLTAEGKDGKKVEIDSFGDTYVSRQLTLTGTPSTTITGVVYDKTSGLLSFVPSTFETKDGKTIATIKRNSNSIYTVIELEKSFIDVNSHWSQQYVELLAGKLIIDGVTDTLFEPDRNITRAEFAALLVRSLGLATTAGDDSFKDVEAGEWYAGVVDAAVKAKLVEGYEDGTFRPNNQITREELAAMVVRAMKYAGVEVTVDAAKQAQLLSAWSDANQIVWGHKEVAIAIEAGLVNGMTDTTLGTKLNATRAQCAAMLERFLKKADFID